jgi:site-specific DNA-methyltransferase (adenine-specific)
MDKTVQSYSYFSVRSYERGSDQKQKAHDVTLLSSQGKGYFDKNKIEDKNNILSKYKVIITYAMSGGNKPTSQGDFQVISSLQILFPNEVCTETYLILGVFDNMKDAENMCSYVSTMTFRFLLLQALTSIHITKESFLFVPLQDFSHPWTDEMLYKKYGLTDEEIAFIESMIRPME